MTSLTSILDNLDNVGLIAMTPGAAMVLIVVVWILTTRGHR